MTIQAGDKAKSYNYEDEGFDHDDYYRCVVTEVKDSEAEVLYLEGHRKGEIRTEKLDDLKPLTQKVWLCLVGRSYGLSKNRRQALINCCRHARHTAESTDKDSINVWMAQVDRNNWKIEGLGGVRSTFIEEETELEVKPENIVKLGEVAEDNHSIARAVFNGEKPNYERLTEVRENSKPKR